MRLLLDTHVVLWLARDPARLSEGSRAAIEAEQNENALAVADKSLWELAMIVSRDEVHLTPSVRDFLGEVEKRFRILPITAEIAARSMQFTARFPRDPADRLIGATALAHSLRLVTADGPIRRSGEVPCIW